MSLKTAVDAYYKEPSLSVKFNNQTVRNVLSVDYTATLGDSLMTATVAMLSKPPGDPESQVRIMTGYNGQEQIVFTGMIDAIQRDQASGVYTVSCRDMLKKALDTFLVQEIAFGVEVDESKYFYSTYTGNNGGEFTIHEYASLGALNSAHPETTGNYTSEGVKAEAVVQWLLIMSGLQEGSQIKVDTTNFFIGDIHPVRFHMSSIYDCVSQISELIGWYLFCDPSGIVRFKKRPRGASGYTSWTYASRSRQNIGAITHTKTNVDLRNYVEVHGASGIKVVERQGSPYLGSTPYRGVLIASDLIDTSGIAQFMARRVLKDLNRLRETISLEVDGNPYLFPGQTIRVESEVANGSFLLEELSSSMSASAGYRSSITATTFPGDVTEEDDPSITALFAVSNVSSLGDPKIIAFFDGSASSSTRGPIVNYEWTFSHTSVYNKSSANPGTWVAFDEAGITGGNTVNATLVVRDGTGQSASLTQAITLSGLLGGQAMLYRHLYAALTTKAAGSQDGGATWNITSCPAVSVAASNFGEGGTFATTGHALFGGSDGVVYKSADFGASVSAVATLEGRIDHMHIPELNGLRALASTSTGKLYTSADAGASWRMLYNFGQPVKQAEYGYRDFNYITVVTSGGLPGAYVSTDAGLSFNKLVDFGTVEMNWYAAGSQTPYWAHGSGIIASRPGPDPLVFAGGASPNIVAMTVALDDDAGIMAVDRSGNHWVSASGASLANVANYAANQTRHMVRDGELPIVTYYATTDGVYKSLDRNVSLDPLLDLSADTKPTSPTNSYPSAGWGEMVAYGPLAPIVPPTFGNIVVQVRGLLNVSTFSGYTGGGLPVYQPGAGGSYEGFAVMISGGWCSIENEDGTLTTHNRFAAAGPSYLVTIANYGPPGTADDDDPIPAAIPSSGLGHVIQVIDFSGLLTPSGTISVGQFRPKFRTVGYSPAAAGVGGQIYRLTDARLGQGSQLTQTSGKSRFYVANFSSNLGGGGSGGIARIEYFDTTREMIRDGVAQSALGQVEFFNGEDTDGRQSKVTLARNMTLGQSITGTKRGGSIFESRSRPVLVTVSPAGGDPVNDLGTDGLYGSITDWYALVKFNPGWRTLASYPALLYPEGAVYGVAESLYGSEPYANPAPYGPVAIITSSKSTVEAVDLEREVLGTGDPACWAPGTTFYAPIVNVCESAVVQSDLYYATPYGIYRKTSYGQGERTTLYTVPSGYLPATRLTDTYIDCASSPTGKKQVRIVDPFTGLRTFSVSHNRAYTRDYLVAVLGVRANTGIAAGLIIWSLDAGLTWETAAIDIDGYDGISPSLESAATIVDGAWWVDA